MNAPSVYVGKGSVFVPALPAISNFIPHARAVRWQDRDLLAVPHLPDETRLLRNLGLPVPAPILSDYDWAGGTPFEAQKTTAALLTTNPRAFDLSEMGCIDGEAEIVVMIGNTDSGATRRMSLAGLHRYFCSSNRKTKRVRCRALKGDRFGQHYIQDVLYKGKKDTIRLQLASGKELVCTPDHEIATPDGWIEAGRLVVGGQVLTNGTSKHVCPDCGAYRESPVTNDWKTVKVKRCRPCGDKARSRPHPEWRGAGNANWKGGRFIDDDGYVRLYRPDHPRAMNGKYVYEHIAIMEEHLGRMVEPGEEVHHKNRDRADNRLSNLEVLPVAEHKREHDSFLHLDGGRTRNGGTVVVVPKTDTVAAIAPAGMRDVYDIVMEDPHRNFVANGVVVHNCGKTRAALYAADWLMQRAVIRRALVLAPLSTLLPVWEQEIFRCFPHRRAVVLHGTREKRLRRLAEDCDFYIVNHDGPHTILPDLLARMGADDIGLVIVDELSAFKNARAQRWKALATLVTKVRWAWGLTGSPAPEAPTDAYAQAKLIAPDRVPKFFGQWRDRTMVKVTSFKWLPKPGAMETVWQAMQPAVRFTREDVIELPETSYVERAVGLSPQQQVVHDALAKHCHAQLQQGAITPLNEAILRTKLLQVACGWVYADDRTVVALPCPERLAALHAILRELPPEQKLICFVPFLHAARGVADALAKAGQKVALVTGAVPKAERDRIFMGFQHGGAAGPRVLVAHPACASHGLTLTAASTIVWWSPVDGLERWLQANARISRAGQTRKTLVVKLVGTRLERGVYARLERKQSLQGALLDLFQGATAVA